MRKIVFVSLILMFVGSLFAQESEVRKVGSFRGIKSAQSIDIYLKKGDKEEVRVETTSIPLSEVLTEVSGHTLKIHLERNSYRKVNVKVYVTYVLLEKISASSASNIFSDGTIKANTIEINASSAASVEVSIDANRVEADASSAANINLEGKTNELSLEVSSAGDIDAYNLTAQNVKAQASSAGSAKVSVVKDLESYASSAGNIRYRGNPSRTNTSSSSGGSVKKSN